MSVDFEGEVLNVVESSAAPSESAGQAVDPLPATAGKCEIHVSRSAWFGRRPNR